MQENLVIMNNLLRSELLGQQAPDTSNENRLDGQVRYFSQLSPSNSACAHNFCLSILNSSERICCEIF